MADSKPGQRWEITVPMVAGGVARRKPRPWTLNDRLDKHTRARWTKRIRQAVAEEANQLRIGHHAHIHASLHYAPGDNGRRDVDNLVASAKPAVDGLTDAGVVDDDTEDYVTRTGPFIHKGPGRRRLWLTVEVRQ